ncbi:MAG: tetraacyldisaccharide 4'-kinase [Aestuariivita sp.]|nr:tetraacyldisaccharide 4'-kinase [Aestuariivita sp.]
MRAPEFWKLPPNCPDWRATLLAPCGHLYKHLTARRLSRGNPEKLKIPVICIGNINVGGVGKTPTVIWLAQLMREKGHIPHVISKGYGGTTKSPIQVDAKKHNASDVGDEPLLIAAFSDVWVGVDRMLTARTAQNAGATILILDDGHQDPHIFKDFSVIVIDSDYGFGNEKCLPAGPLREPITTGLSRADACIILGENTNTSLCAALGNLQKFCAKLQPLETGMNWSNVRVLAFAGIGNPLKFFSTLENLGATVIHKEQLDDHQKLSSRLLTRLYKDAQAQSAQLVTTEKDAVRLPVEFRSKVIALPVRLIIPDTEAFFKILLNKIPALRIF